MECHIPITIELRGDPARVDPAAVGRAVEKAVADQLRAAAGHLGGGPYVVIADADTAEGRA